MTATATATRPACTTTTAGAAPTPPVAFTTPPTRAQELKWLDTLSSVLDHAANTEEPTIWTGESDRLLRVAHELADHLHVHPDQPGSCNSIQNRAFTIAALIKAALQVPGDVPSADRAGAAGAGGADGRPCSAGRLGDIRAAGMGS